MSEEMHTVEISVPGTQTRVLVPWLIGTYDDARALALQVMRDLCAARKVRLSIADSEDIYDVLPPTETP